MRPVRNKQLSARKENAEGMRACNHSRLDMQRMEAVTQSTSNPHTALTL